MLNLNTSIVEQLAVAVPPLPEQRAIAHILGSLDDKIELNRQMNETLEAIARALFKSWFVDFDPVHAKAEGREPVGIDPATAALFPDSFVDSELGPIPAGWRVGRLGDVAVEKKKGVHPEDVSAETPYIGLQHMPSKSIALAEWGTADEVSSSKRDFAKGEILFGKLRPYFHKVGIAPTDGICSTDIVVMSARRPAWYAFALGYVSSDAFIEYTTAVSTGTRMPRTKWKDMAQYPIVVPPIQLAERFSSVVKPMFERIQVNIHESRTLADLRDTLLPKLISGELRVPTGMFSEC